jgi:hypothetical protein
MDEPPLWPQRVQAEAELGDRILAQHRNLGERRADGDRVVAQFAGAAERARPHPGAGEQAGQEQRGGTAGPGRAHAAGQLLRAHPERALTTRGKIHGGSCCYIREWARARGIDLQQVEGAEIRRQEVEELRRHACAFLAQHGLRRAGVEQVAARGAHMPALVGADAAEQAHQRRVAAQQAAASLQRRQHAADETVERADAGEMGRRVRALQMQEEQARPAARLVAVRRAVRIQRAHQLAQHEVVQALVGGDARPQPADVAGFGRVAKAGEGQRRRLLAAQQMRHQDRHRPGRPVGQSPDQRLRERHARRRTEQSGKGGGVPRARRQARHETGCGTWQARRFH